MRSLTVVKNPARKVGLTGVVQEATVQDAQILLAHGRLVHLATCHNYFQDAVGTAGR